MNRLAPLVRDVAIVAAWIGVTACSGASPDGAASHGDDPVATPSPSAASAPPAPINDARYTAADVRHSFRTKYGQDIDCIDFFSTPSVKDLARRGAPLTAIPRPPPLARSEHTPAGRAPGPEDDFAFNGAPDENGNLRRCPEDTVPMVRNFVERGAPRRAPRPRRTVATPQTPYDPPEVQNYAHVTADFDPTLPIVAGQSTFSINAPTVALAGGHSISQIWMIGGTERLDCPPPANADVEQTIEVGWEVTINPPNPYLFMFATNDGYCSATEDGFSGGTSPSFVLTSQYFTPGLEMPLPASVIGGTQHEMFASIQSTEIGWTITVAIDGISEQLGYFPIALNPFYGSFASYGEYFQLGGEVAATDEDFAHAQMGNAETSLTGYPNNAYHRDYEVLVKTPPPRPGPLPPYVPDWLTTPDEWRDTVPSTYGSTTAGPSGPGWSRWFFYGSRPLIFFPLGSRSDAHD